MVIPGSTEEPAGSTRMATMNDFPRLKRKVEVFTATMGKTGTSLFSRRRKWAAIVKEAREIGLAAHLKDSEKGLALSFEPIVG